MLKEKIVKLIEQSIKSLQTEGKLPDSEIPEILVERPEEKKHGDYSTNIALKIAKIIKSNPIEIANEITKALSHLSTEPLFENIEVVNGFINFHLFQKVLVDELKKILEEKDNYGSNKIGKSKTIVIDYSAPNIAKPFGIGHLRSTIIGQAVYNLYKFLGYKVIGDNHLGDWGTQFGKLIYAIKEWGSETEIAKDPIKNLLALYVKFHKKAEKNPALEEGGRQWFKKLEEGDKEAQRIWKKCVKWSLREFDRIYKLLGIKFDLVKGESFYQPMLKKIVKEALKKSVAKESQGAIIIEYPNNILPPFMIQKSDGATLYSTRDLATIKYRRTKFKPFKIIYDVGADQTLHFKQLFSAAELLGWGKSTNYVHVIHGMMRLATGKMQTREGTIIFLENVLEEAIERSKKIVEEKNPKLSEGQKNKIAKIVGIGAVKYNDLCRHPATDIIFDWDKILNLEGNSGPYLQYAYARAKSIIRRSKITPNKILKNFKTSELKEEKSLLRVLNQFPEIIRDSAERYSPNLLCNYLFYLAQTFNNLYETLPILKAETEKLKIQRLALVLATSQIIKNGLKILGIEVLERM